MAPRSVETRDLTDAELLLLGLVAEMPRHGYQIEQELERRGMREWTQIGFSSVYYVLEKLEKAALVRSKEPAGPKAKKTVSITAAGRRALKARTLTALRDYRPTYSSVLLGMIHWPILGREEALAALQARGGRVEAELGRLAGIQVDQQPLPDFVEALFDFSIAQLRAESEWIARTLDYMRTKPWLERGASG
jgi:DNA-binding PadR family transcriptional regulator